MFSRNKINAMSQKCLHIFYGGEKEKKEIYVYNISAESVHKALLQQRLISLLVPLLCFHVYPLDGAAGCLFLQRNCCQMFVVTGQRRLMEKNREINILSKNPVCLRWCLSWYLVMGTRTLT